MGLELNERIIIPDDNGDEVLFEVLLTFDIDETKKSYVFLTEVNEVASREDDEEVDVYAFRYEMGDDEDLSFFDIESDEEWEMVEEMFHTLVDEDNLY